jgi:hypothetical protein
MLNTIVQLGLEDLHLALKLVFVLFAAFGLAFPTFNFGFCNSVSQSVHVFVRASSNLEVLLLLLFPFRA